MLSDKRKYTGSISLVNIPSSGKFDLHKSGNVLRLTPVLFKKISLKSSWTLLIRLNIAACQSHLRCPRSLLNQGWNKSMLLAQSHRFIR